MKTFGRLDATVESLETKWRLWKQEGDRLLARLERRDQRAAKRAEVEVIAETSGSEAEQTDISRRIKARRGNAVSW